ncbi:response regulator transcription factor [Oerskovia sp. M15]
MTKVLLVDDQALVRMGFRLLLESAEGIEVVGEAGDGRTALDQVGALRPDVVVMDVRMPGVNGIDATRNIVQAHPGVRILVLTTFDLDEYAFAALRAGASGFLLRMRAPPTSSPRYAPWPRGRCGLSARHAAHARPVRRASSRVRRGARAGAPHPRLAGLTPRELDVLRCIADGQSNAEIAVRLFLSETTVKTHVGRILAKLGVRDRLQAVVLAYESGLTRTGSV